MPHFEGLTVKDMLQFAEDYPEVADCLPDRQQELSKVPRDYITCVCNTKIGDPFQQWVKAKLDAREEEIIRDQNQAIDLDEETAAIVRASKSLAGKYHKEGAPEQCHRTGECCF